MQSIKLLIMRLALGFLYFLLRRPKYHIAFSSVYSRSGTYSLDMVYALHKPSVLSV
jgi:hypothetical protein